MQFSRAAGNVSCMSRVYLPYLSPVSTISMALLTPTALMSRCVPPMPGNTPSCTSGCRAAGL